MYQLPNIQTIIGDSGIQVGLDPNNNFNLLFFHESPKGCFHFVGEQSTSQKVAVTGQLVGTDPGTGHMVYVSHPNLANVGQLVGIYFLIFILTSVIQRIQKHRVVESTKLQKLQKGKVFIAKHSCMKGENKK